MEKAHPIPRVQYNRASRIVRVSRLVHWTASLDRWPEVVGQWHRPRRRQRPRECGRRDGGPQPARDALYWSSSPSRPLCRRAERRQGDTLQELQKKGRSRAGRNKHAVTLSRTRIRRRASVVLSDFCSSRNELRRASGEDDDGGRCRRRHGRRRERETATWRNDDQPSGRKNGRKSEENVPSS